MSTTTDLLTAERLSRSPPSGWCELVRGELHMMAPSGAEHGGVTATIALLLGTYVRKHKLGRVFGAETGFLLTRDPDTVRGADVAFVRAIRIPKEGLPKSFWLGAPDLAVEVLSPDDRPGEVKQKVNDYLASGALMVWVVDPKRKSVTVHRPNQGSEVVRATETLHGEYVVPGFKCRVADVFE